MSRTIDSIMTVFFQNGRLLGQNSLIRLNNENLEIFLPRELYLTGSINDVMRRFHDSLRRFRYSPQAKSYVLNFR